MMSSPKLLNNIGGGSITRARGVDISVWPPVYDSQYLPANDEEYWCPELECAPADVRDVVILQKLKKQVRYAWEHSPFYKKKWSEAGV